MSSFMAYGGSRVWQWQRFPLDNPSSGEPGELDRILYRVNIPGLEYLPIHPLPLSLSDSRVVKRESAAQNNLPDFRAGRQAGRSHGEPAGTMRSAMGLPDMSWQPTPQDGISQGSCFPSVIVLGLPASWVLGHARGRDGVGPGIHQNLKMLIRIPPPPCPPQQPQNLRRAQSGEDHRDGPG